MTVRVLLVRHGQTDWNVERRWQGQSGPRLNAVGRAQARAVAHRLREAELGAAEIVSSDLERADETGRAIADVLGLRMRHDRRLRELDVGSWSGFTHDEIAARDPEAVAPWGRGDDAAFGGAETLRDLRGRVLSFLDDLVELGNGRPSGTERTVIAVTHGGVIRAGTAAVLRMPELQPLRGCANASITTVGWSAERGWWLASYNSDEHLAGAEVHAEDEELAGDAA
jgi:glucosyl-3-phosphoglycerate phosphatase